MVHVRRFGLALRRSRQQPKNIAVEEETVAQGFGCFAVALVLGQLAHEVGDFFVLFLGGIVQFGIVFWTQNTLTQVVRDTGQRRD